MAASTLGNHKRLTDAIFESYGEKEPVAAFVYIKEDILEWADVDEADLPLIEQEGDDMADYVLASLEDNEYIRGEIRAVIAMEVSNWIQQKKEGL